MRNNEEHNLQKSMITWFDMQYPKLKLCLFAVPNGANTSQRAGAYMKSEGLRSGVADLVFCYDGVTTFVEVKTQKGKQSDTQVNFQDQMASQGFTYKVVRTLDEFMELINGLIKGWNTYIPCGGCHLQGSRCRSINCQWTMRDTI